MIYKIPLFDLNYGKSEENAIIKVLKSKWISTGTRTAAFESVFAKHLGVKHVVAVSSGTASLHLAMLILGIKEGDEVIVPSFTFVATANAVRYVQATPVFADIIGPEDLSLDPHDVSFKITPQTKAILVMHYAGYAADMSAIMNLAKKHKLYVVEDAAHAPDAEYDGRKLGTFGDIGCFSFFSNKNITCAEGGCLATNNPKYARRAQLLRTHGMTTISYERAKGHVSEYDVVELGYNYRMDDIRGALLLSQLKKLESDRERREELRMCYLEELSKIKGIIIPYEHFLYRSSNYIFPVLLKNSDVKNRDRVRKQLSTVGIQTSVHYPAVHRLSIYEKFKSHLPKTEYAADNEITLPLFYTLTKKEIKYISKIMKGII